MAEVAGGILYGLKNLAEGAALLAKGIYDPTLPLKAHLQPISSVKVPLAHHTISVIKGRAYLFGGKTSRNGTNASVLELAESVVHVVILPTSGSGSVDYKLVKATTDAPPKRYGHSAAVIDECIYIFGGAGEDGQPLEENGRVWVYDTQANTWTYLDPVADGPTPEARVSHASVASDHPQPPASQPPQDILPQQPPDPETTLPSIPDANTYGTLIVQGGVGKSGNKLMDTWSFDLSTRTWRPFPEPPAPSSPSPSLTLLGSRLYTFSSGQVSFLDLGYSAGKNEAEMGPMTPLRAWQSLPPASSSPEKSYPGERSGAAIFAITTGQGRNYLLLLGGKSHSGEVLQDIWTLQLPPESNSAASLKDAARGALQKDTKEAEWEEVKYFNSEGVMVQEGQDGRGLGVREGFAADKASDLDGESVVVWGGVGGHGGLHGDGLVVSIEI